ncbi:hypothetical protein FMEXI_200 [Fusarium mexicanum]|uniref:Uncharacterized protein n=1 Tax=Fusarium mexicanum TaxID=751941 RepID=A0A8H5JNZ4_9HYPO|nr:hypothetical protein FMEXI_200 [Fusarium mexicanum]
MPSFLFLATCLMAFAAGPATGSPSGSRDAKPNGDIVTLDYGVVTENGATKPRKDMLSTNSFDLCKKAPNCEIYDHPQLGKSIRFVAGMEPGSEHYNATVLAEEEKRAKDRDSTSLEKRDREDHSNIDASRDVINWGNVQPQVVMNNLYNPCQESMCDSTPQGYTTTAVRDRNWWEGGSAPEQLNIRFTAIGHYDGWDSRNKFIESIKTMSEKGQSWTNQHWFNREWNGEDWLENSGDQWEIRHSNFFGINRFSPEGYMKGYMQVTVSADWGDSANWGCDRAKDFVKDAIGAISPWGSAFFGLLIEGCK